MKNDEESKVVFETPKIGGGGWSRGIHSGKITYWKTNIELF